MKNIFGKTSTNCEIPRAFSNKALSVFLAIVLICSMIPLAPQVFAIADAGKVNLTKTATPLTPERTSDVSLSVVGNPLVDSQAIDIVLVLDVSRSMDTALGTSTRIAVMKAAAKSFISEVLPAGSNNKVSIVAFSGLQDKGTWNDGSIVQSFTNVTTTLNSKIDTVSAVSYVGYTNMEAGFYHADAALDTANGARADAKKVVVYMSDGAANLYYNASGTTVYSTSTSVTEAINAAQSLLTHHAGTLIYTVGLSDGTNSADIAKVLNASNQGLYPTKYFDVNTADGLTSVYNYLADTINQIANTATVTDILPDGVTFDGFIATPYGTTATVAGNTVTWTIPVITTSPLTLTYRVKIADSIYGGVYTNANADINFKPVSENHFYDAQLVEGYVTLVFPKPIIPAPPIANDDAYASGSGKAVVVQAPGILTNDEAVDLRANGDGTTATPVSGSVSLVSGPSHGTLAINADGSFNYLPAADYDGIDSFVYKIFSDVSIVGQDTVRVEDTATVTITNYPEGLPGEIDLTKNANATATDREFEVTLTAAGNKPETAPPTDYILVMDVSNSMRYLLDQDVEGTPSRLSVMKEAAADFVSNVLASGNDNRVAVVSYSSDITGATTDRWNDSVVNQAFSNNASTVNAAINALVKRNATNTEAGFYSADNVLDTARADVQKIVVFMSDGGANQYYDNNGNTIGVGSDPFNQTATNEAIASAKLLKTNHPGTLIYTMGIGQDLYGYIAKVMNPVAPDNYQEKFFQVLTASDAAAIYEYLAMPSSTLATDAVVTDILPAGVSYAGSLTASAGTTATINGKTITWTIGTIKSETATLTYRVKVDDSIYGGVYTNESAVLKFRPASGSTLYTPDASGFAYLDYPLPVVAVGPIAVNDAYSINEGQTLTTPAPGVLANDPTTILRADGAGTTATATNQSVSVDVAPLNGTLNQNQNGSFTYEPDYGFYGIDTYKYRVYSDVTIEGKGTVRLSATAVVTITVNYVNDAPDAVNDNASTDEDTPVTIAVLTNDSDPNGDDISVKSCTQPSNGTAILLADGKILYTPKSNFTGTDTFTYTIRDVDGLTDTATVTIAVGIVNDPPVAVDDQKTTPEDQPVTISVLLNDQDVEGDQLSIYTTTNPAHGSIIINADGTIQYTPAPNYAGPDSFEYTITDGNDGFDTATVTITVTPVNDPPKANDDARTTPEDTAININVLANDSDAEGDNLTVTSTTAPGHGSLIINVDGTITYTPNLNFNGTDTFTYTISDGQAMDTATVTIQISAVNDLPLAVDDTQSTPEDMPVVITVLSNDSDPDGDPLTVVSTTNPGHGSVALNADGTITYQPNLNYCGPDAFTYTISDGKGGTDTATVTLNVIPVNDAPIANNDIAATPEDVTVKINVLINDSDPDQDPLTVTFVSDPAHGSAGINPDNSVSYTPDANYTGIDTFIYTISDGQGGICTATVTITVGGVNDPPVAVDDTSTTPEDTAVVIAVLTNDTDVDGDPLSVLSVTQPGHGAVIINTNGTVTYTPAANYFGPDQFEYTVTDGQGGTDTAVVTLNVTSVNDAPDAVDDARSTPEDTPIAIDVLTNDLDADNDTLIVTSATNPAHGAAAINADGTITYTPNVNFNGTDTFAYTISDGHGGQDTATVSVTIVAQNDAPIAVNDIRTTEEDMPVTVDVLTNDLDPDGDALNVTAISSPANGTAVINADGTVTYSPNANFNGQDTFNYTISDGQGGIATANVIITINPVNDAPVAVDDARTTPEDTAIVVDVLTNDLDLDGDPLQVLSATQPTNGSTVVNTDGTVTYTPDENYFGTDSFEYTISDGQGGSDTATVTITIESVNDKPVAVDDDRNTPEDTPIVINVLANDYDDDNDPLSVESATAPANGMVVINSDMTVTYTPDLNFIGIDTFDYTISDGQGGSSTATVTLSIGGINDAPIAVDDDRTTPEDTPVAVDVLTNDSDVDGDTLTVVATTDPANGTVAIQPDGRVLYTPNLNFNGTDTFNYTISDGNGGADSATVTVKIESVNDASDAIDDARTTPEDTPIAVDVLTNDTDVDGDTLTVTSVTQPGHGSASIAQDGKVLYTPDLNFVGIDTFQYTINDGQGGTDTATVTITIAAVNDAPVAINDERTTPEDSAVIVDVLTNDTDPDGDLLTVTAVSDPAHGITTINPDGTVTYLPDADYVGPDTFNYTISDGNGGIATAIVTITVTPVNDPPMAADDTATVPEDQSVSIDVLINDQDIDGDSLTVESVTQPTHGAAVINPDGTVTYTPEQDFNGTDTFTYTISDGNGGTDTANVTVTVTPVNDPPVAVDDAAATSENAGVEISVLSNDSDIDGDALTVISVTQPAHGTSVINPDGTVTYTPANGYYGSDTFDYTISDGQGGTDTAIVAINVSKVFVPGITISKLVANLTQNGIPADMADLYVGEIAQFTIVVTNNGNTPLDNVIVTDSLALVGSPVTASNGADLFWTAGVNGIATLNLGSMAVGESITLAYNTLTSQTDLENSPIINRADVVATPDYSQYNLVTELPADISSVSAYDTAIINISATPLSVSGISIENLVKNLTQGGSYAEVAGGIVGDVFRYSVTVKNTGLLDLTAIKVYDNRVAPGTVLHNLTNGTTDIWQAGADGRAYIVLGDLAPGATVNLTYDVTSTTADAKNVRFNTTQAKGIVAITQNDLLVIELSDDATATVLVDQIPTTGEQDATTLLGAIMLLAAAILGFLRLRRRKPGQQAEGL